MVIFLDKLVSWPPPATQFVTFVSHQKSGYFVKSFPKDQMQVSNVNIP